MREVTYGTWPLQLPFSVVKPTPDNKMPDKKGPSKKLSRQVLLLQNAMLSQRITKAMAAHQNMLMIRTSQEFDRLGLDAVVRANELRRDQAVQIALSKHVRVKLPKHQLFQRVG